MRLYADTVFPSCKALSIMGIIFDSNEDERGQKIILLANHSKINRIDFVKILDVGKHDVLVTDRESSNSF